MLTSQRTRNREEHNWDLRIRGTWKSALPPVLPIQRVGGFAKFVPKRTCVCLIKLNSAPSLFMKLRSLHATWLRYWLARINQSPAGFPQTRATTRQGRRLVEGSIALQARDTMRIRAQRCTQDAMLLRRYHVSTPSSALSRSVCGFLLVTLTTVLLTVGVVSTSNCPSASTKALSLGIGIVEAPACATSTKSVGCIGSSTCRFCQLFSTERSQQYELCAPVGEVPESAATDTSSTNTDTFRRCLLAVSAGDAAVGLDIITDSSCGSGGVGCVLQNCRFCRVWSSPQADPYLSCGDLLGATSTDSDLAPTPEPTPTPVSEPFSADTPAPSDEELRETPGTNYCSANLIDMDQMNAGVWAFVDEVGCLSDPTACALEFCRFCKYVESSTSQGYRLCPDVDLNEQWLLSYVSTQQPIATTLSRR